MHTTDFEEDNIIQYVNRSLEDEEEFHFLRFEFLQRLNLTQLTVKLCRLKSQIRRDGKAEPDVLSELSATLRDYTTAIRDYEELRQHKPLDKAETRCRKLLLQRFFQSPEDYDDPFQSHYCWFKESHERIDPLRQTLMKNLPSSIAFSHHEKQERKKEYMEGQKPKEVSGSVDRLVRFIVALAGGLFLVAPMLIMSINPSQLKSLLTVSSAVLFFALAVSLVVRVSNIETLVSTATYAAVLVVFVGTTTGSTG
ncbi:hypothetical protein OQA88_5377 [Cercophora sp. LCS_1]